MPPDSRSLFLSADHVAVVVLTFASIVLLCGRARRDPAATWIPWFMRSLAALQVVNAIGTQAWLATQGRWTPGCSLPCQLCDAAIAASVVALLRPSALAFELTYFWGFAAALQGLVTPSITERFPHPVFLQFFIVHAGLVTAGAFLAFGLGRRPRPGAVWRMMLWTNGVAVVAGLSSWLSGGNYMFTRSPPPTGSLLNLLGPWPWYLLACEAVALVAFTALTLPFVLATRETDWVITFPSDQATSQP